MDSVSLNTILQKAIAKDASDVHLIADKPPVFRVHGELVTSDINALSADELHNLIFSLLTEKQKSTFLQNQELDFSYSGLADYQCRFNLHREKGHLATTIRITPTKIEGILKFQLPSVIKRLAQKRSGLVIISGTAGSGKSTTLTYMIDIINNERKCKIVTIEDPIEYVHQSKKSLIIQREVGSDTLTFANALKYALRQDPDVVVIGEMRDYESISMALTTAETGHLVITTVHAPDVIETINRIIDVYPIGHRDQICAQLAGNLLGIISQRLVPKIGSSERTLATEVLLTTISIRNLIRRGAFVDLRPQMDSEEDPDVHTLEKFLSKLVRDRIISIEAAETYAKYPNMLDFSDHKDFRKSVSKEEFMPKPKPKEKSKEKIFIVDGDVQDIKDMLSALTGSGFQNLSSATTGKEALSKIGSVWPDLIILDAGIYDIDSFSLCKDFKNIKGLTTKVIMITKNLKTTDSLQAKAAGADGFVIKTKAYELLLKSIESLRKEEKTD